MRIPIAASVIVVGCVALYAQAPTSAPLVETTAAAPAASANPAATANASLPSQTAFPRVEDVTIGFSSSLPADWQGMATVQGKFDIPYPTAVAPRKGDTCVEVDMTARHGGSGSVVVVVALPFDCYGQTMSADDLANFGMGAAEGLKQTFAIVNEVQGKYSLGNHAIWIERADGTPKHRPENPYTFEIACTVLGKGAACWMTMAVDAASLRDFEQQAVTLEGDSFDALVPAGDAPAVPEAAARKAGWESGERGHAGAPRVILNWNGVLMHTRAHWSLPPAPAAKHRSRVRGICPRRHLRVLPTRTRPSLFGGD